MSNETTPLLVWDDKAEKERIFLIYQTLKDVLQNVLDIYNGIRVKSMEDGAEPTPLPKITSEEFAQLFREKESVLFDKLTNGKGIVVSGIALNKTKALEIIEKPEWWDGLVNAIDDFKGIPQHGHPLSSIRGFASSSNIAQNFIVSVDGQTVDYSEKCQSQLDKSGKHYLTNERSIAMYEFCKEAIKIYTAKGFRMDKGIESLTEVLKNSVERINVEDGTFKPTGYLYNVR